MVGEVLKTLFHHYKILQKTVLESLKITVDGLIAICDRARIPIALQPNIVAKLRAIMDQYNLIKKNRGRVSDAQTSSE